jgi:integrase
MQGALDQMAALLAGDGVKADAIPWHDLRPDRTTWLKAALLERYKPSTVRKMLAALSGVLKQCWREGLLDDVAYRRLIDWGQVKGSGLTGANAGRHVTAAEVRALFWACADSPYLATAARNASVLGVLFGAGLRRAEIVALDLEHFDPQTGETTVRGKGNKIRLCYVTGGGREAVQAWLRVRGQEPGPLFVAVNKVGRLDPARRRLTTQAVYAMLQRLARTAKVAPFSPHDGRRTFAGDLLDAGVDAATVQKMLGHASLATTGMYDRRGERAKQQAAGQVHIPYVQPTTLPTLGEAS